MFEFSKKEVYVVALLIFAIFSGSGILILKDRTNGEITVTTVVGDEPLIGEVSSSAEQGLFSKDAIYVDVSGAVNKPGVYELENGARVFHAIERAGGVTEDAFLDNINLATVLYDAQKVHVPRRYESSFQESGVATEYTGKVRINTASSEELQTLPGVGVVIAQRIINHREQNGPFASIEDIRQVSGIGEKTYQEIKDMITTY
jgi:competence protein ComEA